MRLLYNSIFSIQSPKYICVCVLYAHGPNDKGGDGQGLFIVSKIECEIYAADDLEC